MSRKNQCSPHNYQGDSISCYSRDNLIEIAKIYNQTHNNKIPIRSSDTKRTLWNNIQQSLRQACGDDETCWLRQPFLARSKLGVSLEDFFKPPAPLGPYQWLSTKQIASVMKQHEKKHSYFKFFGPFPIDFMDVDYREAIQFRNPKTIQNPSNEIIGVIFNMDPSDMAGSHWVALVINKRRGSISYFDSYGDKVQFPNIARLSYTDSHGRTPRDPSQIPMPPQIQQFIAEINQELRFRVKVNTIQHQYANSECGVYSMHFILKSLKHPFEKIAQDILLDEEVNRYRDVFFRRQESARSERSRRFRS
jgi:hypothetical protein